VSLFFTKKWGPNRPKPYLVLLKITNERSWTCKTTSVQNICKTATCILRVTTSDTLTTIKHLLNVWKRCEEYNCSLCLTILHTKVSYEFKTTCTCIYLQIRNILPLKRKLVIVDIDNFKHDTIDTNKQHEKHDDFLFVRSFVRSFVRLLVCCFTSFLCRFKPYKAALRHSVDLSSVPENNRINIFTPKATECFLACVRIEGTQNQPKINVCYQLSQRKTVNKTPWRTSESNPNMVPQRTKVVDHFGMNHAEARTKTLKIKSLATKRNNPKQSS